MDADEHTAYFNDVEIVLYIKRINLLFKLLSYPKKNIYTYTAYG